MTTSTEPADSVVCLVSGANRGLGAALVDALLARPDTVVIMASRRPDDPACQVKREAHPDRVRLVQLDLRDEQTIRAAALTCGEFGRLDVLVNCAAVNVAEEQPRAASKGPVSELTAEALGVLFDVNVVGPMLSIKHLLPLLRRSERGGVILNISTQRGSLAAATAPGSVGYSVSKAALNMLTRKVAAELAPAGVTSLALDPGWVRTRMGGAGAPVEPRSVADKVVRMLVDGPLPSTGGFYDADGRPLPW